MIRQRDKNLVGAIRESARADRYWKAFMASAVPERLDVGQLKLVSLAMRNLSSTGPEDARMAGMARWLFARSAVLKMAALEACSAMRAAGLKAGVLKGMALSVGHGVSLGDRPMWDADLITDDFERASAVLAGIGFRMRRTSGHKMVHAVTFDRGHAVVDLHRFAIRQDPRFDILEGAEDHGGVLVPEPTKLFIHLISHGVRSDSTWLFDAPRVLGRTDLARVEEYAVRRRCRGVFGGALVELGGECAWVGRSMLSGDLTPEELRELEIVRRQP